MKITLKNTKKAFTLLELIVVVVIIGILAGIMVPSYTRARERAIDKQAKSILSLLRSAERNYKMETGVYYPAGTSTTSLSDINSNLNLDLVDDGNWDYTVAAWNSGATFIAALYRNKGGYIRTWTITSNTVNATCSGTCP
ncbi:MAG: prepilin-type N-terminal cleavage/methylation domain-containing protein [Candidatus Omnitrophica bacterium]|nr:prepilin-type N-terminal cleavage/methylation domain-containing protein [Candidatus Omnitrophota bacterium]